VLLPSVPSARRSWAATRRGRRIGVFIDIFVPASCRRGGVRSSRRHECAKRTARMTSPKLRAIRVTRVIRDAYAQLRDDYARLARGSTWREVFVIAIASAAAGAILCLVMSALWGLACPHCEAGSRAAGRSSFCAGARTYADHGAHLHRADGGRRRDPVYRRLV